MPPEPDAPVVVMDSGALIALERSDPAMTALLARVRAGDVRVVVPDSVLAQVWRGGGGRQARTAALLGLRPDRCRCVPLDTAAAKRVGMSIGQCGHADIVDVHVVICARDHSAAIISSDRTDLVAIDSDLADLIIDV